MLIHLRRSPEGRVGAWIAKARSLAREMGPLNGAFFAAATLAARWSRGRIRLVKYYIYAQPVGRRSAAALRPDPATVIEPARPDSPLARAFPRPAGVIRGRYEQQAVCLAATVKSVFAGFIWLVWHRYDEDEVRCRYVLQDASRCAWDFDVYVAPQFRLGRTLARIWEAADAYLGARGVQWSFSRISAFNPMSIATHERLGAVRCHTLVFLAVGPLQLSFLPQFPFAHLSLSDARRPTLRLRAPSDRAER